jgi:hypothetical protein
MHSLCCRWTRPTARPANRTPRTAALLEGSPPPDCLTMDRFDTAHTRMLPSSLIDPPPSFENSNSLRARVTNWQLTGMIPLYFLRTMDASRHGPDKRGRYPWNPSAKHQRAPLGETTQRVGEYSWGEGRQNYPKTSQHCLRTSLKRLGEREINDSPGAHTRRLGGAIRRWGEANSVEMQSAAFASCSLSVDSLSIV